MKLLLDSHIFLWLITNDPQLDPAAKQAIQDGANEVFLSVVSVWEITIKYGLGKLPLPDSPDVFLPAQRLAHGVESLALDEGSVGELVRLPHLHRDPFDRMLIAQARHHGFTLVTQDQAVLDYPVMVL